MSIRAPLDFIQKKQNNEKIVILTCYDYTFGLLFSRTSLDAILVGDSLGNVIQGEKNTIKVSIENMIYHTKAVRKALPDKFLIVDVPFFACRFSMDKSLFNVARIVQETGCNAVKIEGAGSNIPIIERLVEADIPVMGHIGLQPQSSLNAGGYVVQAKTKEEQKKLKQSAIELEKSGCFAIVLELVSAKIAEEISSVLKIPVIGIGAGPKTDGQVLVMHDLLGLNPEFKPRFVRNYLNLDKDITQAIEAFCQDVRSSKFPSFEESFYNQPPE